MAHHRKEGRPGLRLHRPEEPAGCHHQDTQADCVRGEAEVQAEGWNVDAPAFFAHVGSRCGSIPIGAKRMNTPTPVSPDAMSILIAALLLSGCNYPPDDVRW